MARRNPASGVSDRHAMLSAYGYGYPSSTASQHPPASLQRTASPFEQPYASSSASGSASAASPRAGLGAGTGYGQVPYSSSSHKSPHDPYAEYDRKKFDEEPASAPAPAPAAGGSALNLGAWWSSADRQAEQLEEQNDARIQGLSDRVRILKDITLGIGNEVRDGTKDLNSLQEAMSNASAFLGGTFTRMNRMARRQGGWFCNMMLFLLFVCWIFVFLWWWRR